MRPESMEVRRHSAMPNSLWPLRRTHGATPSFYQIIVIVIVERYEPLSLLALRGRKE